MSMIYEVKLNPFYLTVEELCQIVRFKNRKSNFSKKMYGNHNLLFMVLYREKLQMSWDRFIRFANEINLPRQLGIKKMPVKSTFIDFVKRTPKTVFEQFVRSCRKLLKLENITAAIDGTGFSNTNPSHHYIKRSKEQKHEILVKNYTKTVFLADIKNNLILDVRTTSGHEHETLAFKPMVKRLHKCLKTMLADKGYDSMSNRKTCWDNNIEVHIPFRKWSESRHQEFGKPSKRKLAEQKFDKTIYNQRALVESVNSAIKQTLGGFVRARNASQQQKTVTLKAITYNIEHIQRKTKIVILLDIQ